MPLAVLDVPLSVKTPSGRVISLTPEEEEVAFKRALQRSVEECALECLRDNFERRKAIYSALGLAAGIALGGLILAALGGGRK
jgi:hypothetical protein